MFMLIFPKVVKCFNLRDTYVIITILTQNTFQLRFIFLLVPLPSVFIYIYTYLFIFMEIFTAYNGSLSSMLLQ